MIVRVQQIDGTLEPAIRDRDDSELVEEVGTTFALDDGRVVQVIGHERETDGSIRYVIVGELPEPRIYSATGREAYVHAAGEWAMGSEQYGSLVLDGTPLSVGEVEEGSLLWSLDGRYLAAAVSDLVITRSALGRRQVGTKVIVIDAESRKVVGGSNEHSGHASPLWFVGRSLAYDADDEDSWSYLRF